MLRFGLLLLLSLFSVPAAAQDHVADVRTLLQRTGIADEARHAIDARMYHLRDERKDVYGEFWVEFMATVRTDVLLDSLAAAMAPRLTERDVEALLKLTGTSEGAGALRAWTRAAPGLAAIIADWDAGIDRRLVEMLEASGYETR